MSRAIVSAEEISKRVSRAAAGEEQPDSYRDKLFKYIPAEVITLYLALSTVIASATDVPHFLYWAIAGVGLIATPLYLRYAANVTSPVQLTISSIAFVVWVFALGGPFQQLSWYRPMYGALLLPIYTFFVAMFTPPVPQPQRPVPAPT